MLPKKDLRVIFLYEFKLRRNGAEAYQNIVDAWGEGSTFKCTDDKLRCHNSKIILKKFSELKYEALPHLPYFPDLSPTIFNLFKHLDVFFKDKLFKNRDSAEEAFTDFIKSKKPEFYKVGIQKLVERWEKCVESNGYYFT
uniref:HTH_48 domain-containing protein n=1 Tax=Strongyloides papillosus TaxID=174720 RepID=A0A0N5BVE8_STREA